MLPKAFRVFDERYRDAKTAHRQFLLKQANWLGQRASGLTVFAFELTRNPTPDKFKLSLLISKLDPKDQEWAMKETDTEILRRSAEAKAIECRDGAAENSRLAEEIGNRVFLFRL